MEQKTGKYILELEKKFEQDKKQNKDLVCLHCKTDKVFDLENSNLCQNCRQSFGHNYLREL
jgi:hypothetical protein